MRRSFVTSAAFVSLLLFVTATALWVRSYWTHDRLFVSHGWGYANFAWVRGELGCEFGRLSPEVGIARFARETALRWSPEPAAQPHSSDYVHIVEADGPFANMAHYHDVLGFRWHPRMEGTWEYRERGVAVPLWSLALATAGLPAFAIGRAVRRGRQHGSGRCGRCGYDLRATPGRCPECGAVPERGADSPAS